MTAREWHALPTVLRTVIDGVRRYGLRLDDRTGATVLEPVDDDIRTTLDRGTSDDNEPDAGAES